MMGRSWNGLESQKGASATRFSAFIGFAYQNNFPLKKGRGRTRPGAKNRLVQTPQIFSF